MEEKKENKEAKELLDELRKTREDMNAGMYGKKNTTIAGKIGAGCLVAIIISVIVVLLFVFTA